MKNKSLLLIVFLTISIICPSYAAFPVKQAAATNSSAITQVPSYNDVADTPSSFIKKVTHILHPFHKDHTAPQIEGKNGRLSLLFGILALASTLILTPFIPYAMFCILLFIPAFILGIKGKKNNEKYADAGYILGAIGVSIILLAVIIAIITKGRFGA